MKRILLSIGIFFLFMASVLIPLLIYLMRGLDEVANETINPMPIEQLEDGTYIGSYTKYRWKNTLEVRIEAGQIVSIIVIDDVSFSNDQIQTILFERIMTENTLEVDTVVSATVTSKAYLKAIEDALSD